MHAIQLALISYVLPRGVCHAEHSMHSPCMRALLQEPFTYIDRIDEDCAKFKTWLEEKAATRAAAFDQIPKMREHSWFPDFCQATGVPEDKWGHQDGDPVAELELFNEWLLHATQARGFQL